MVLTSDWLIQKVTKSCQCYRYVALVQLRSLRRISTAEVSLLITVRRTVLSTLVRRAPMVGLYCTVRLVAHESVRGRGVQRPSGRVTEHYSTLY